MTRGWIILTAASIAWLGAIGLILASVQWTDLTIALASAAIFAGLVWIATMGGRTRR